MLSWLTALTEVGGGVLLIVGLLTPFGAAGILGITLSIVALKWNEGFFAVADQDGFEFEMLLGAVALALLFSGPGRLSVDRKAPWQQNPVPYGLAGLALAVVTSAIVLLLFR
jgi:putative oxidoreductase